MPLRQIRKTSLSRNDLDRVKKMLEITKLRMELGEQQERLVDAGEVRRTWVTVLNNIARALDQLPGQAADEVMVALKLPPKHLLEVQEAIRKAVNDLRARLLESHITEAHEANKKD